MLAINWRITKTPNADNIPGIRMPGNESIQPTFATPTYQGMIMISLGIMMVARIIRNITSLPGKRYLAKT